MMVRILLLGLLTGCGRPVDTSVDPPTPLPTPVDTDTDAVTDTDTDTDLGDTDTDAPALHGVVPTNPLPLPQFAVRNFDGTSRGPEALLGHVTVMWFLPAAATGG